VVFQVKDAGETRAGEIRLAPRAIVFLLVHEVRNGVEGGRIAVLCAREQTY